MHGLHFFSGQTHRGWRKNRIFAANISKQAEKTGNNFKKQTANMYYTAQIFKPEEGFGKIIEAAGKFNMDRFIYAIGYKNWNEEKIERLGDEVSIYRRKLDIEYKNLVKFAECFNKQFATPNNKCFETALHLLKKLRSGISETKKLFLKFCPRARYEKLNQAFARHKVSAYEYAYISTDSYQLPLLTIESFPPQVMALFREMEKFFT